VSPSCSGPIHHLAADLELRFAYDATPTRRLEDVHELRQVEPVAHLNLTEGKITVDQCCKATVPRPLPRQMRRHRGRC
jgi:hypothetical protein